MGELGSPQILGVKMKTRVSPLTEISILLYEGIIRKASYERHGYESVDEKSLS